MSDHESPISTAGLVIHVPTARLAQPVDFKGHEVSAIIDSLLNPEP